MKRVLIAVSQLRVGGVSKALIELLKNIVDKYDVTLLCFDHHGAFFEDIPSGVAVIEENPFLVLTERAAGDLREYGYKFKVIRQVCSAWSKCFNKVLPSEFICRMVGQIEGTYDVAIAFGHPQQEKLFCNLAGEVVLNCVDARKKVIVIHCDYGMYGGHCKCNDKLLLQFDRIAAVSRSVGEAVAKCVPEATGKICVLRNFHDFASIMKMADDKPVLYTHKHTLVTVARLSEEKGIIQGLEIIEQLRNSGYDVEWHIVGDGPLKKTIIQSIAEKRAENYVFLEGEQKNPYRYLKNADYLFVPSIHEAAPMVFDEAACLKVPIVSTVTLSAAELVKERNIGFVGKIEDMVDVLIRAVETQDIYKEELDMYVSSNMKAMQDFDALCND